MSTLGDTPRIAWGTIPRLFQLWACKQVHSIAGTNQCLHKQGDSRDPRCPSCLEEVETCAHVLMCNEEDRVKCFQMSADNLQSWLQSVGTSDILEEYHGVCEVTKQQELLGMRRRL